MKANKPEKFIIGFIGRLVKSKGVEYLLLAIHHLIFSVRTKLPDFQVLIVGDGPYKETLECLSRKLKIDSWVSFVGRVRNSLEWISKFDILINPTLELEALGMVNLEAYACKIPVIAFGKDAVPESVKDGVTGFVINPGDYKALAESIQKLYADTALRKSLGSQGYALLMKEYHFDKQVRVYEKCLKKLIFPSQRK
jgi:glycosyltransferase involved in cell wall biosynthesis